MTQAALFVCSMNVCRSPLMQWAFLEALSDSMDAEIDVSSRGVDAGGGNAICVEIASLMQGSEFGKQFAQHHASKPLTHTDLAAPDLVIVATRAERAMLARYAPALRSVTFTLREANLLAAGSTTSLELAELRREEDKLGAPLALFGFPSFLHRRRGRIAIPQSRGWGRSRVDPLDIPDSHLGRSYAHKAMLRSVNTETRDLASRLAAFAGQHSAT